MKKLSRAFFAASLLVGLSIPALARDEANSKADSIQVNQNTQSLNHLFSKQWVRLDSNNGFAGNLVSITEADKVAEADQPVILVKDGEIIHRTVSDDKGGFRFANVEQGSYSLITRTENSVAAFSLQVLGAESAHLPSEVEVRLVRPAGEIVTEILRTQTLPTSGVARSTASNSLSDPLKGSRSFGKSHVVKADSNGNLMGQLGSVDSVENFADSKIYILKDGVEVASSNVSKDGSFKVEGLAPGVYGLVAAGDAGFAATSFQFVNTTTAAIAADGSRFVSAFGDACGQMNIEVVSCCEVVCCEPAQIVESVVEVPIEACGEVVVDECECGIAPSMGFGGGYGGGGYGGGGGGGFGGGGLGGIAGIAGLAAVAGILAANDNNNNAQVQSAIVP